MPFLPIQPCCLEGTILPGTPAGIMELPTPGGKQTVGRYHTRPKDGRIVDPKAAVVLFYDAFGFNIPNPKILADAFADKLGINVFVADVIPSAPKPEWVDSVVPTFPGEKANNSWFQTVKGYAYLIFRMLPFLPSLLPGRWGPLALKAIQELNAEGYEKIGAIGYCMGGSMVTNLLSLPSAPITCGVLCHPGPDTEWWGSITKPTLWHLASHDMRFKDPSIGLLRQTFEAKQKEGVEFDCVIHSETTHGFAARPNLKHEPTKKAFEDVAESSVAFFRKQLLGGQYHQGRSIHALIR